MPLLLLAILSRLVTKKARIWASRAAQSAAVPSSHRPPAFSCCLGTLTQSNTSQPTDSSVSKYYFLEVNCKILPHPQSGLEQSSFSRCWEYYAPGKHKKKKNKKHTRQSTILSIKASAITFTIITSKSLGKYLFSKLQQYPGRIAQQLKW